LPTGTAGRKARVNLYCYDTLSGTAGGYNRSDIFCYTLKHDAETGGYFFEHSDDMHPKIKRLEAQLSAAIMNAAKGK